MSVNLYPQQRAITSTALEVVPDVTQYHPYSHSTTKTERPAYRVNEPGMRERQAYVTLLTDDHFSIGAFVLLRSLRNAIKSVSGGTDGRSIVVMVTEDVSPRIRRKLTESGAMVLPISPIDGCKLVKGKDHNENIKNHVMEWDKMCLTKLRVWGLVQFNLVLYIDADCLVLESVDEIFERGQRTDFAAAPDIFPPDRFNAGVMLLKPNEVVLQDMISKAMSGKILSYDGGDTGFLNEYFSDWYKMGEDSRLPFRYNAQRTLYWFTYSTAPGYWDDAVKQKKIIHYSSQPKPWDNEAKKGELEMIWWSHYFQIIMESSTNT